MLPTPIPAATTGAANPAVASATEDTTGFFSLSPAEREFENLLGQTTDSKADAKASPSAATATAAAPLVVASADVKAAPIKLEPVAAVQPLEAPSATAPKVMNIDMSNKGLGKLTPAAFKKALAELKPPIDILDLSHNGLTAAHVTDAIPDFVQTLILRGNFTEVSDKKAVIKALVPVGLTATKIILDDELQLELALEFSGHVLTLVWKEERIPYEWYLRASKFSRHVFQSKLAPLYHLHAHMYRSSSKPISSCTAICSYGFVS